MLDLKKLEENFKNLFEQETEDSFNEWLEDKMKSEALTRLGEGEWKDFESKSAQICGVLAMPIGNFPESLGNPQYAMAA